MTSPFHDFWALGYRRLVPIVPPDAAISERSTMAKRPGARGKAVGVRNADGTWQGFNWVKHEAVEADLDRWAAMGAGVGIKTGAQPDGTWLVGIDADTLNLTHATLIRIKVSDLFGLVPCRVGRAPKALYVVRVDKPLPYTRVEFDDGTGKDARVEVLSEGRQFVAHGIHPDTRMPYEWTVPLRAFDGLPVVSTEQFA